jgi:hypothetical protein
MVSLTTTQWCRVTICLSIAVSACSVVPTATTTKTPTEGVAKVRAATEAAVASSDLEISKDNSSSAANRQSTVQCDTVGSMFVCTDGKAICWWNRRTGYGCN